tara:strand:- start:1202 stop:1411 length:210 start_codon:yes stop_codon:yes gene_type:complete
LQCLTGQNIKRYGVPKKGGKSQGVKTALRSGLTLREQELFSANFGILLFRWISRHLDLVQIKKVENLKD